MGVDSPTRNMKLVVPRNRANKNPISIQPKREASKPKLKDQVNSQGFNSKVKGVQLKSPKAGGD